MNQWNYSPTTSPSFQVVPETTPAKTLVEDLIRFQNHVEDSATFAASTKRIHISRIRQLVLFIQERKVVPSVQQFPGVVGEFMAFAREELTLKANSINNLHKTFRLYSKFANLPVANGRVKAEKIERRRLTLEEEVRYLDCARTHSSPRTVILSLLFLRTDIRLHECVSLEMSQVCLDAQTPHLQVTRGGREMTINLSSEVVDSMRIWLAERANSANATSKYVFCGPGGNCLTTSAIDSSLRKIGWRSHLDLSARILTYTGRARRYGQH